MAAVVVDKELLIEAVRKMPCLYDTTKKEYKDELVRENAWKSVCSEVFKKDYENEVELMEDVNITRRTFKNLRDRFMKIRKDYKPSGSAGGVPIEPKWPFYQQMLYLAPFMKYRSTRSNLAVEERAPLLTASNIATAVEEESFYNATNEACDVDNFSLFEVETVEESPKSPEAASSYGTTVKRKLKRPGSSLETVSPSPSETSSKKMKRSQDNSQLLIEVVQNTSEFLSNVGKRSQADEDDLFGQSVGKELKTLSPYKKSLAKMKIQQILHEIRWVAEDK